MTTEYLEVVRIPCDGSSMFVTAVPLVNIGSRGISMNDCDNFEKELGQILDLRSPKGSKFSWAHRKLVGLANNDMGTEPWKKDYMMYMCLDERSGLPHNEYLEELVNLGEGPSTPFVPFKVYGDAFVFRMGSTKSKQHGENQRAKHIHMDWDFVDSALSRRRELGSWAWIILRKLLIRPEKGAWRHR